MLFQNFKEGTLEDTGSQTTLDPNDFHCIEKWYTYFFSILEISF